MGDDCGNADRSIQQVSFVSFSIRSLNHRRWSIDLSAGEKIRLGTFVRSKRTKEIFDFFVGSALSLARDFRVDVRSLRLGQSSCIRNTVY